jgi:carboxyl-terminal processing protease
MRISITKLAVLAVMIISIAATTANNDRLYEIAKNIEIFVNVYKELNKNYVDDLDPSELMRTGIDAMVSSLDPYTNYISEAQVASYRISTDGKYQGIGAVVKKVGDYVTIVEPYENSPVIKAGLKAGDKIVKIQGRSTKGQSTADMNQILRGVPGTKVQLGIDRNGKTFDVDLERSQVSIPNVPYSGLVSEGIGYVVLTTFTANAGKNIRKAIKTMKDENPDLKGVVLDLRNNGGGLLKEAINISNIFVDTNLEVVSVRSKVSDRDVSYKTRGTPLDMDLPLVVLINKRSASASEIVSGVIQDLDRGVVMGQRSYGKGLVQNTMEVGYNSRVKVTTSKYYIPSGRCIQSVKYEDGEPVDIPDTERSKFKTAGGRTVLDGGGVTPDVVLENLGMPDILKQLDDQHIIFQYINTIADQYATEEEEPSAIDFKDYAAFASFVKQSDFEFESKNNKLIEELKDNLKKDKQLTLLSEVEGLEKRIDQEQTMAMETHKAEIISYIEQQIATRNHFQKGKYFQRLDNDTEIDEAVALLNDPARYKSVLGK